MNLRYNTYSLLNNTLNSIVFHIKKQVFLSSPHVLGPQELCSEHDQWGFPG